VSDESKDDKHQNDKLQDIECGNGFAGLVLAYC
jgi:hypothetical protein